MSRKVEIRYVYICFFFADNNYKVKVHTGDKFGSGTDANVFLKFSGPLGDSGLHKLDNKKNNFETGK